MPHGTLRAALYRQVTSDSWLLDVCLFVFGATAPIGPGSPNSQGF